MWQHAPVVSALRRWSQRSQRWRLSTRQQGQGQPELHETLSGEGNRKNLLSDSEPWSERDQNHWCWKGFRAESCISLCWQSCMKPPVFCAHTGGRIVPDTAPWIIFSAPPPLQNLNTPVMMLSQISWWTLLPFCSCFCGFCLFAFHFWSMVSLCSPGWPEPHSNLLQLP